MFALLRRQLPHLLPNHMKPRILFFVQGLRQPITTVAKVRNHPEHSVFLLVEANSVVGFLKVGKKNLFMLDKQGEQGRNYFVFGPCFNLGHCNKFPQICIPHPKKLYCMFLDPVCKVKIIF